MTVKRPTYNFEGENTLYCIKHKEIGMINVKHKRCNYDGCHTLCVLILAEIIKHLL